MCPALHNGSHSLIIPFTSISSLLSATRGSAIGSHILAHLLFHSQDGFISSAWESSLPWSFLIFHLSFFHPHYQLSHFFHQGPLHLTLLLSFPYSVSTLGTRSLCLWSYSLNGPSSNPIIYPSSSPLDHTQILDFLPQPDPTFSYDPTLFVSISKSHLSPISHSFHESFWLICLSPPPPPAPHCFYPTIARFYFNNDSVWLDFNPTEHYPRELISRKSPFVWLLLQQPQTLTAPKTCLFLLSPGGRCLLRTCFSLPSLTVIFSRSSFLSICRVLPLGRRCNQTYGSTLTFFPRPYSPEAPGDTSHKECGFPDLGGERRRGHF